MAIEDQRCGHRECGVEVEREGKQEVLVEKGAVGVVVDQVAAAAKAAGSVTEDLDEIVEGAIEGTRRFEELVGSRGCNILGGLVAVEDNMDKTCCTVSKLRKREENRFLYRHIIMFQLA